MADRPLFSLLLCGIVACGSGSEQFVWTEPLVATSDGGVLVLTVVAESRGDIVEQRCSDTHLTYVSAALNVRRAVTDNQSLCAATQAGNVRAGLDEFGRLLFADLFDGGQLKVLDTRAGTTIALKAGCLADAPVLAGDVRSHRVAIFLAGCERTDGYWIHILQLSPDLRVVVNEDSMRTESPPRSMAFGPGQTGLLVHVRDTASDRIVILDLAKRTTKIVTTGRLPASQSTGTGLAFVRDEGVATDAWALMFSDSVSATAREVLSMRVARERIGDSSAVNVSAPIVSLDNQYVWLGFAERVLRVHLTTGTVDVVVP